MERADVAAQTSDKIELTSLYKAAIWNLTGPLVALLAIVYASLELQSSDYIPE